MRYFPLALAVALSAVSGLDAVAQVSGVTSLTTLRDHARTLLIFAPRPDDPELRIQLRTSEEHAAEAHDPDLVAIALPYNSPSPRAAQLSPEEAEATPRRFHVAPADFTVVLIGKDGGAKLRSSKPLSMDKLNETIDAMPMRQQEMRAKPRR